MAEIEYDKTVLLSIQGRPARHLPLAEAIRKIIAIPQKGEDGHAVVMREGPSLATDAQIVSLYARPDFPE